MVEYHVECERRAACCLRAMPDAGWEAEHVALVEHGRSQSAYLWNLIRNARIGRMTAGVVQRVRQRGLRRIPPALASGDLQRRRHPRVEMKIETRTWRRKVCPEAQVSRIVQLGTHEARCPAQLRMRQFHAAHADGCTGLHHVPDVGRLDARISVLRKDRAYALHAIEIELELAQTEKKIELVRSSSDL